MGDRRPNKLLNFRQVGVCIQGLSISQSQGKEAAVPKEIYMNWQQPWANLTCQLPPKDSPHPHSLSFSPMCQSWSLVGTSSITTCSTEIKNKLSLKFPWNYNQSINQSILLSFHHRRSFLTIQTRLGLGTLETRSFTFLPPIPEVLWDLHWALWMHNRNPDGWKDTEGSSTLWDLPESCIKLAVMLCRALSNLGQSCF